jgi:putative ABC transport system ATP-binding protein
VILTARGLRVHVAGRDLLRGLDLDVDAGERIAVLGPSGAGKTSLLAVLAGLAAPAAGSVEVEGAAVAGRVPPGVGVVLQGYGLVSLLTAAENVAVGLRLAGRSPADAAALAMPALAAVGLAEHAGHLVEELSGGQQQRVAVARALAARPRLLVADEPTAEQDTATRDLVLDRLLAVASGGGAVVLATHDAAVADRCDRVITVG